MTDSDNPNNPEATPPTPAPEAPASTPATEAAAPVETPASVAPPAPVAPISEPAAQPAETDAAPGPVWGLGRRKSSVARVRIKRGSGKILINKREVDKYFTESHSQQAVRDPLLATDSIKNFDVIVNVRGGGFTGQGDAIRLGVARALVKAEPRHESALREKGFLTRDARVVERKKYGRRKARRRFQFSKR